jgi:hypothetical protein
MKKTLIGLLFASGLSAIALSAQADYYVVQPPIRYEPAPTYVPPGQHWQAGHWRWDGYRYVWVEGHWVRDRLAYAPPFDRDRDGVPNRYDRDIDGDGVPNRFDRAPYDPYRS